MQALPDISVEANAMKYTRGRARHAREQFVVKQTVVTTAVQYRRCVCGLCEGEQLTTASCHQPISISYRNNKNRSKQQLQLLAHHQRHPTLLRRTCTAALLTTPTPPPPCMSSSSSEYLSAGTSPPCLPLPVAATPEERPPLTTPLAQS